MKTKSLKVLSVLLALTMVFSVLGVLPATAWTNGFTITEINFIRQTGLNLVFGDYKDYIADTDSYLNNADGGTVEHPIRQKKDMGTTFGSSNVQISSTDANHIKITPKNSFTSFVKIDFKIQNVSPSIDSNNVRVKFADTYSHEYLYTPTFSQGDLSVSFAFAQYLSSFEGTVLNITLEVVTPPVKVTLPVPTPDYYVRAKGVNKGTVETTQNESFEFEVYRSNSLPDTTTITPRVVNGDMEPIEYTGGEQETDGGNGYKKRTYTIDSDKVTKDFEISLVPVEGHTISYNMNGADYNFGSSMVTAVKHDGEFTFSITPKTGYQISHVFINANDVTNGSKEVANTFGGIVAPSKEGDKLTFTVKNVKTNLTINAAVEPKQMEVTFYFSSTNGFSIDPSEYQNSKITSVPYNGTLTFQVITKEGYQAPTVTYSMGSVQNRSLTASGNTYTIANITDSVTVNITDSSKTKHTVTWSPLPGATIKVTKQGEPQTVTSGMDVDYGTELTIEVTVDNAYSKSKDSLTVVANGTQTLTKQEADTIIYKYTVKSAVNFAFSGLSLNTYTVTTPTSTDAYTISYNGSRDVRHGGLFEFTINVKDGYKVNAGSFNVTGEGFSSFTKVPDRLEAGTKSITVTISDIKSDIKSIKVEGIEKEKYTATVDQTSEGTFDLTFTTPNQGSVEKVEDLAYNSSINFTVKPKSGYTVTTVEYRDSTGVAAPLEGSGGDKSTYGVKNITSDITIIVHTEAISITINYNTPEGTTPRGEQTYTVEKMQYDDGAEAVKVDGDIYYLTLPGDNMVKRPGFKFLGWIHDSGAEHDGRYKFTNEPKSYTVTANWSLDPNATAFKITLTASLRVDSVGDLNYDVVSFTATVDIGNDVNASAKDINDCEYTVENYGLIYGRTEGALDGLLETHKENLSKALVNKVGQNIKLSNCNSSLDAFDDTARLYAFQITGAQQAGGVSSGVTLQVNSHFVTIFGNDKPGKVNHRSAIAYIVVRIDNKETVVFSEPFKYTRRAD